MNKRVIGLDIGDVRIGIAISDEQRTIAQPFEVYKRIGYGPDVKYLVHVCDQHHTNMVVCGLPKNMDGSQGGQVEKVLALTTRLEEAGLVVFLQDERMTTLMAQETLIAGGMRRENRRETVDKIAAAIILQQWLDQEKMNHKEEEEMEIQNSIIELIDETGEEVAFEHLMTIEHEEEYYIVLLPVEDEEEEPEEEAEVFILQIAKDEQGDDSYITVEEEEVLEAVFAKFIAAMQEEELFDEEDLIN
ncbi:MAG: Holliday junction resolvase RuvX [Clostridiales bacterium]|nr:Holliday junction resolvase RuvX [Clostridiales bacterium]